MASDPDHLIERAAARLRTANSLVVPDQAGTELGAPGRLGPQGPVLRNEPPGPVLHDELRDPTLHREAPDSAVPGVAHPVPSDAELDAAPDVIPRQGSARLVIPDAPGPAAPGLASPGFASSGLASPGLASPSLAASSPGTELSALAPAAISIADLRRVGLVVSDGTRNRISEEYRIISDRLRRGTNTAERALRNLVMVTSARPGEGKSFTALNLAASIARSKAGHALLVDADVGPRALTLQLGLKDRPGLHDLISDPALRPDPFVIETEFPGLHILPMGHPARIRNGTMPFGPALERLARRYANNIIVLDTPPALSTSDPHAIAPHVAQVVLVVEAERTQRGEVEAALDLVRACPVVSAMLNKTRLSASHTFGAYDDHYYYAASA
jgi:receptor protein-tyrosine kinase